MSHFEINFGVNDFDRTEIVDNEIASELVTFTEGTAIGISKN